MQPRIQTLLESKLNQSGDELGDTLIANSIITDSVIFNTRVKYLAGEHISKIAIWSKLFVRKSVYLLRDDQRFASTKHGSICTLINPETFIQTLVASWSYKLLISGESPAFKPNWFEEYNIICDTHGFMSLDHMINYTDKNWEQVNVEKHAREVSPFVHQSIINLCRMGFKREPVLVFEDLMNQHLFGNRHIINPHTNNPWILKDSLFAHIQRKEKASYCSRPILQF